MKNNTEQPQYKLGLALSGGGARGFAHLGVLQAMEERNLKPDLISGTSAGALAGALYADGRTPKEILKLFEDIKFSELATTSLPRNGFFKMKGLENFLEKHLRAKTFEELKLPLKVLVSDIELGESVLIDSGELIKPVLASCALPIFFEPVRIGDKHFVDGGLFVNFPATLIRSYCKVLIGVNISPLSRMPYARSFKYMVERSLHYLMLGNALPDREVCDYLIESLDFGKYSLFDLNKSEEIFDKGYEVASSYLEENKEKLAKSLYTPPRDVSLFTVIRKLFP